MGGGGILGYLQGLGSALAGNAQQQPAAAPAAGGGAATPASPYLQGAQVAAQQGTPQSASDIPIQKPGLLDNPYLQGALGAYFGAISSPRQLGWGGAIGRGGLGGLSAYESAKKAQYEPYMLRAQIQHLGAQTAAEQAKAGLDISKTGQISGIADHNTALAGQLRLAAQQPGMDPHVRDQYLANAAAIEGDKTKAWDPTTAFSKPWEIGKDIATAQAEQQKVIESQAKLPGELGIQQAQIQRDLAETTKALDDASLTADRRLELQAHVGELQGQLQLINQQVAAGGVKPQLKEITLPSGQQGLITGTPGTVLPQGAYFGGKPPPAQALANQKAFLAMWQSQHPVGRFVGGPTPEDIRAAGLDPNTWMPIGMSAAPAARPATAAQKGGAAPALPAGWKMGPPDASGRPTAIDASGVPHHWED